MNNKIVLMPWAFIDDTLWEKFELIDNLGIVAPRHQVHTTDGILLRALEQMNYIEIQTGQCVGDQVCIISRTLNAIFPAEITSIIVNQCSPTVHGVSRQPSD